MNLVDIAQNSTEAAQQSTIEVRRELAEANRKLELSRELGKAMAVTADDLDRKLRINTLRDKEIAGLRAAFVSGKITANDTRRRPLVFTVPDIDSVERSDRPLPFELPGIYL